MWFFEVHVELSCISFPCAWPWQWNCTSAYDEVWGYQSCVDCEEPFLNWQGNPVCQAHHRHQMQKVPSECLLIIWIGNYHLTALANCLGSTEVSDCWDLLLLLDLVTFTARSFRLYWQMWTFSSMMENPDNIDDFEWFYVTSLVTWNTYYQGCVLLFEGRVKSAYNFLSYVDYLFMTALWLSTGGMYSSWTPVNSHLFQSKVRRDGS